MSAHRATDYGRIDLPLRAQLIVALDAEGRIESISDDFARVQGCGRDDLTGEYFEALAHPDTPTDLFQDMLHDLRTGRPWSGVVRNRTRDGADYWARLTVVPARMPGRGVAFVATLQRALSHQIERARAAFQRIDASPSSARFVRGQIVSPSLPGRFGRWMGDLSLRARLAFAVGFALLAAMLAIMVVAGWPMPDSGSGFEFGVAAIGLSAFSVLFAGWIVWRAERRVADGVRQAGGIIARIAEGDFDVPIACDRDDDVGRLMQQLQMLQIRLGVASQQRDGAGPLGADPLPRAASPLIDANPEPDAEFAEVVELAVRIAADEQARLAGSETLLANVDNLRSRAAQLHAEGGFPVDALNALREYVVTANTNAPGGSVGAGSGDSAMLARLEALMFEARLLMLNLALAGGRVDAGAASALSRSVVDARTLARDLRDLYEGLRRTTGDTGDTGVTDGSDRAWRDGLRQRVLALEAACASVDAGQEDGSGQGLVDVVEGLQRLHEAVRSDLDRSASIARDALHLTRLATDRRDYRANRELPLRQTAPDRGQAPLVMRDALDRRDEEGPDLGSDACPSANVSQLRPVRHGVASPVPRVRRAAAGVDSSLADEWSAFRE
ncbi:PAS domain S-box protein [Rhodocyclaceae bacterium SMB388]